MKHLSDRQNIAYWLDYIMNCRITKTMSHMGWRYMLVKVNGYRIKSTKK